MSVSKKIKKKTDQDIDNLFASSRFLQRYISIPLENKIAFLQELSDKEIDGYLKEGYEVNKTKSSHMTAGNFQMYLFHIARTQIKKTLNSLIRQIQPTSFVGG